jgi:hypothetical protein
MVCNASAAYSLCAICACLYFPTDRKVEILDTAFWLRTFVIGLNLMSAAELHSKALSDTALLNLSMYGKDPNDTTIVRAVMPNAPDTLTFEGDRGEGDFVVPAEHEKGSLEDTWRIDPQSLHCRRKSNGELYKLGDGECFQFQPIDPCF